MTKTTSKSFSNPVTPVRRPKAAGETPKIEKVIKLLKRPKGAALSELMAATGWQSHTVRGAISGTLKLKRGLNVVVDLTDTGRRYRIAPSAA